MIPIDFINWANLTDLLVFTGSLGISCSLFALQVLYRKWPFGRETEWLCRIANSAQDTPMFMSSFAITAIAADRFRQGDNSRRVVFKLGCANKDLRALCAPIFTIVVYCKTATSYFLGGKK